jgi:RNAse (barnase) inhibitor barstar
MLKIQLEGQRMLDWPSFHTESHVKFGFPDFYGRNMDAWVDCLSGVRDDDGMSSIVLAPNERLLIEVSHSDVMRAKAPHILEALQECVDTVNEQYAEDGEMPPLQLAFR